MNRLLDKLMLMLICLIGFCLSETFVLPVAALLLSVAVSSVIQICSGRAVGAVLIAGSAVLCGIFPEFVCALPLLLYDALWEKKWWLVLPSVCALFHEGALLPMQLGIVGIGIIAALIVYRRVSTLEQAVDKLTALRDEMSEKNMQLAAQNRRLAAAQDNEIHLATLRERNRIAREIHDNVGHMLTRSLLQSGALLVINKDERMKDSLESLKSTLDSAMTSIRQSVHDLHDDSVDLRKAVEDCIRTVDGKFSVRLEYDLSDSIPGSIRLCLAGIIKEGLSNAVKHSDGDSIKIVLREHPGFYQLLLEDNGHCPEIRETGIGLQNMEDRAHSVGGTIRFTPSEKGFGIFMSIPKR